MIGVSYNLYVKPSNWKNFEEEVFDKYTDASRLNDKTISSIVKGISKAIVDSLRSQLDVDKHGYFGVGYATGNLYRSIKANGYLDSVQADDDSVESSFEFEIDMAEYADTLSEGTRPMYIPISKLIKWVQLKGIRKGWEFRRGAKASYENVAFSIQRAIAKRGRDALLPDWNDFSRNNDLQKEFDTRMKTRKTYYQKLIRDNFKENLDGRR
jgi:hypothetical protein